MPAIDGTGTRMDFNLSPRESFRGILALKKPSDNSVVDLTGSTVEFFIKPLDLTNEASVLLTTAADEDEASISVSTIPSIFPDEGFVAIDSEIIRYGSQSSNTLAALVRGADESVAAAHEVNSKVVLAGRLLNKDGPADEQLIIDEPAGEITIYIADEVVNSFTWAKAEYRLQITDSLSDIKEIMIGYLRITKRWAQ